MATRRVHQEPEPEATPTHTPNAGRLISAAERIWLEEGDLALNVRRLLSEAKVTNRDLYLSFGSRDSLLDHVADALAEHVQQWATVSTGTGYVLAALERPAAWRALQLGRGPRGLPAEPERFSLVRARIRDAVGGDAELAKLDGVVGAVIAGQLSRDELIGWGTDSAVATGA